MCRWFPCRWIPCRWFPCMWIRGKSGIFRKNRGETPKSLILLAFSSALPGLTRGPELSPLEGPRDQAPGQAPRSSPSRRPQTARMRGATLAPVLTYCPRPSRPPGSIQALGLARPPGPRAPELAPGAPQGSARARTREAPGAHQGSPQGSPRLEPLALIAGQGKAPGSPLVASFARHGNAPRPGHGFGTLGRKTKAPGYAGAFLLMLSLRPGGPREIRPR